MKRNILRLFLSLSIVYSILMPPPIMLAQQSNNSFNSAGSSLYPLPSNASLVPTAEQTNAWNNLTESEKADAEEQFEAIVKQAISNTKPESSPTNTTLSFVNGSGSISETSASANTKDSPDFGLEPQQLRPEEPCPECSPTPIPSPTPNPTPTPSPTPTPTPGSDADSDGLPDSFENSLADGFTPFYFVSGGENSGTGFASFNNSAPQTVNQVFGSTPPRSNFRVTPLRIQTGNNGIQYGLIQIDYLTLWNRDDGLVSGNTCVANPFINTIELTSHPLDNERSALLVAAPISNGTYNTNLQAYKVYSIYTAAHENTFFDQSRYINLSTPVDINNHILLGLARSKHGTYTFNPNYFPIVPLYIINATYLSLYFAYYYGQISYLAYLTLLFIANQTFFSCVVERFQDVGGVFANTRINVGEIKNPINNSGYIQDTAIRNKLNMRLW